MDPTNRDEIIEHYKHPRNYGHLDSPTIHVEASNPLCGDKLQMDLLLHDGVVQDVRFSGKGCAISQASASMLTEDMLGARLDDLARTSQQDILDNLGIEVSYARMRCALLSLGLLRQALAQVGVAASDED